jgi:hypothetical protein
MSIVPGNPRFGHPVRPGERCRAMKVVTLGEVLVEVMAQDVGRGFCGLLRLMGPFPSGAPAIFIDQVAKLGQPCGIE